MIARRPFRSLPVALLVVAGCDSLGPAAGPPVALIVVSGNEQQGVAGTELPDPVVVKVVDAEGRPVKGQTVSFRVTAGGGSTYAGFNTTDGDGVAKERWRLGRVASDSQRLEARAVDNSTGAPLLLGSFKAVARPGPVEEMWILPGGNTLIDAFGSTSQFNAAARDSLTNQTTSAITWSSSNESVATITASGLATAVGNGITTITASVEGKQASTVLEVFQRAVVVAISPQNPTLDPGATLQLVATATDANGHAMAVPPVWSSSDPLIATVNPDGLVTGAAAKLGPVTISVLFNGPRSSSTAVSVEGAFTQVATGRTTTCALKTIGSVYCWGEAGPGPYPMLVAGGITFSSVYAGDLHFCGLDADGRAYCWGRNNSGQLGDGSTMDRVQPVAVAGGHLFSSLGPGEEHTCGVALTTGEGWCWGRNGGRLGNNSNDNSNVPVAVSGGLSFTSISAGWSYSCGVAVGGIGYCWGLVPTAVPGDLTFEVIDVGADHTCGITTLGDAYCWGRLPGSSPSTPQKVAEGLSAIAVGKGDADYNYHNCGLGQGVVICWGTPLWGQLGLRIAGGICSPFLGPNYTTNCPPAPASNLSTFISVDARSRGTCAVTASGAVYCWGVSQQGQAGAVPGTTCTFHGQLTACVLEPRRVPGTRSD